MPRLARFALIMCLLAVAAAVVSFANGSWLGIVWVLLAGITSNMWWYYRRKARVDAAQAGSGAAG
jgi:Flp pilus assembly protein TadB